MSKQEFEFENWYDILVDQCRILGYHGRIDIDWARTEYDAGKSPEQTTKELNDEIG